MIYFLYCEDNSKYYGIYNNPKILNENLKFVKLNFKLENFCIYQLKPNEFSVEKTISDKLLKYELKLNKLFVLYCKETNNFIHYNSSKEYLKKMIQFFKKDTEYSIIEVILNSLNFNINENDEHEDCKIVMKKEYTDEELIEKADIIRQLNLLKFQKKRLEDKRSEYDANLKLYFTFKKNKQTNNNFIIPELFLEKYKIFSDLESSDNLFFEKYLEEDPKKFLDNSYQLLFEGGNNIKVNK